MVKFSPLRGADSRDKTQCRTSGRSHDLGILTQAPGDLLIVDGNLWQIFLSWSTQNVYGHSAEWPIH